MANAKSGASEGVSAAVEGDEDEEVNVNGEDEEGTVNGGVGQKFKIHVNYWEKKNSKIAEEPQPAQYDFSLMDMLFEFLERDD